jgi:hypothetical protein
MTQNRHLLSALRPNKNFGAGLDRSYPFKKILRQDTGGSSDFGDNALDGY